MHGNEIHSFGILVSKINKKAVETRMDKKIIYMNTIQSFIMNDKALLGH